MEAVSRPRPARPPQLPQQPRKKEEFATSSKLAGAGARIAAMEGQSQPPLQRRGEHEQPSAAFQSPRRPSPRSARGSAGAADVPESARGPGPRKIGREAVATPSGGSDASGGAGGDEAQQAQSATMELHKGGEVLLKRLADMSAASEGLRHQLEAQAKEVGVLEEASRAQQQLIREYEQQVDRVRRDESLAAQERARKEFAELEAKLRQELEESRNKAQRDREDLLERLRQADGERRQREGERDEARKRVQEMEAVKLDGDSRLEDRGKTKLANVSMPADLEVEKAYVDAGSSNTAAPADAQAKLKAVEMELNLLRARFAREAEGRQAAEKAESDTKAERMRLKAEVEMKAKEIKQLQKAVAEQAELASFREELCNDLQQQLRAQKDDTEQRLRLERGKFEAVRRLEGVLPRSVLMKALVS